MILSQEDVAYLKVDLKGTDMRSMTRGAELYRMMHTVGGKSILVHVVCSDIIREEEELVDE